MLRLRDCAAALAATALIYAAFVFICAFDDGCAAIHMAPML
jgi:hypothetical protein